MNIIYVTLEIFISFRCIDEDERKILKFSKSSFSKEEQESIEESIDKPNPNFLPYVVYISLKNDDSAVDQQDIVR